MSHTCHARGCNARVPPRMFMCKMHWFRLPKQIRDAIWATYKPGQEVRKDPSVAYLQNAKEAIDWLAQQDLERAQRLGSRALRQGRML